MIAINRLTIDMQYWFVCKNFKVFGRYKGHDKNILKIGDAYIYFSKSSKESFCIEQYFLLDSRSLFDIKIDDTEPDHDYSEYYSSQ